MEVVSCHFPRDLDSLLIAMGPGEGVRDLVVPVPVEQVVPLQFELLSGGQVVLVEPDLP